MRTDRIEMVSYDPSWTLRFTEQATVLAGVLGAHLVRDIDEHRRSFWLPDREHRTHHLHVVLDSHEGWGGWISFRDRLRGDDDLRQEYATLKSRLAAEFGDDPNDRARYRAGKADLIERVTASELGHR